MHISLIGCGVMGRGLARRLSSIHKLSLYSRHPQKTASFAEEIGATNCLHPKEASSGAELLLLAVKPDQVAEAARQLGPHLKEGQLLLSIASGISTEELSGLFESALCIRSMPNIACFVGKGLLGLAENQQLSKERRQSLEEALMPLGHLLWLPEEEFAAFGALAGSGPAFVMAFIESVVDSGIAMGLRQEKALEYALELLKSSAELVEASGRHPALWKADVCSPAGTTIRGICAMEAAGFRSAVIEAFLATFSASKKREKS